MDAETLARQLNVDVFRPARLTLADGSTVGVPVPYLSFVKEQFLYVARATSADSSTTGEPRLLPLRDIVRVEYASA